MFYLPYYLFNTQAYDDFIVWITNPNIKFLDPCSKTGIFLREIANRLNNGLKDIIKNDKKRSEHIFLKQIYHCE